MKTLVSIIGLCASLTLLAFTSQYDAKASVEPTSVVFGQVLDKATGEPLAGVCITPAEGSQSIYTDFDGRFSIEQTAGSSLNVSLISYEAQQIQVSGAELVVELMQ